MRRHIATLCAAAISASISGHARAWVESEVRSHVATVDVDRAGRAVVTEDLGLAVRGGPLPSLELSGVDLDAEPLPGASVSSVAGSKADLPATPLLLDKRDDGTLRIEVDREKGLRTGVYSFHFQYRTDLLKRGLIRREGNDTEVRWIGPRFTQGVDSARVVFRLPAGPKAPILPEAEASSGRVDDADALGGVFIGTLHRLAEQDELEIVRPHIARGEPVLWRVRVSAKVFDAFANAAPATLLDKPGTPHATQSVARAEPKERLGWWLAAALLALAYAAAVSLKWRKFSELCALHAAEPRALVALPIGLRAALAGSLLAAAFISAAWFERATLGATWLLLAMSCASQFAASPKLRLRGPGQWLPLSDAEAFGRAATIHPGRLLDAGTLPGLSLFASACLASALAARWLFPRAPYQALLLLLGSSALLPLFFTGRLAQLPADLATRPRALLGSLLKQLRRASGIKVVAWARIPDGSREPDELRLLVSVQGGVRGLIGLEIGVEYGASQHSSAAAPFVLIRAREGSLAALALPRQAVWTRGRKPDERASILRPRLPTRSHCERLVLELLAQLRDPADASTQRPNANDVGARRSVSRVMSPAHVL